MEQQNNRDKGTVAVIGGGVAGIVAAHLLQKTHRVTLFEQGDYLGGHTHTIAIPDGPDAGTPVDTGFIVFNEATYPHFIGFLAELGVPSRLTEMSFGYHCLETGFVYAGNNLNGVFAQRSNILKPQFYRFLLEIGRFCRQGKVDVETPGRSRQPGRICSPPPFPAIYGRQLFKTHGGGNLVHPNGRSDGIPGSCLPALFQKSWSA